MLSLFDHLNNDYWNFITKHHQIKNSQNLLYYSQSKIHIIVIENKYIEVNSLDLDSFLGSFTCYDVLKEYSLEEYSLEIGSIIWKKFEEDIIKWEVRGFIKKLNLKKLHDDSIKPEVIEDLIKRITKIEELENQWKIEDYEKVSNKWKIKIQELVKNFKIEDFEEDSNKWKINIERSEKELINQKIKIELGVYIIKQITKIEEPKEEQKIKIEKLVKDFIKGIKIEESKGKLVKDFIKSFEIEEPKEEQKIKIEKLAKNFAKGIKVEKLDEFIEQIIQIINIDDSKKDFEKVIEEIIKEIVAINKESVNDFIKKRVEEIQQTDGKTTEIEESVINTIKVKESVEIFELIKRITKIEESMKPDYFNEEITEIVKNNITKNEKLVKGFINRIHEIKFWDKDSDKWKIKIKSKTKLWIDENLIGLICAGNEEIETTTCKGGIDIIEIKIINDDICILIIIGIFIFHLQCGTKKTGIFQLHIMQQPMAQTTQNLYILKLETSLFY